jgi:cysteinyl-tRNA synthetase
MAELPDGLDGRPDDFEGVRTLAEECDARFRSGLDDDLNISVALAQVHEFVGEAYKRCRRRAAGDVALARLAAWDRVLGVLHQPNAGTEGGEAATTGLSVAEIEALIEERTRARQGKDFAEADRIRDVLRGRGIVLKDTPQGTRWQVEDA